MRLASLVLAGLALLLTVHAARAQGPLPFADGTYVTDPALCAMTASETTTKFGDMTGAMVRNLKGNKLDNGYELSCTISNVRVSGNTVRFRAACEAEGEAQVIEATWVRLDPRRFRVGQRVFQWCGRLIE